MSDATPDFLSDEPSSAPVEADPKPAAVSAPAESAPAPTPAPETPAAPAQADPAAHPIPLATFLDTRERLQAAERKAKELETWKAEQEAKARQTPIPNREQDPEGFEDFRAQQMASQVRDQTMLFSRRFAVKEHGQETVDTAFQWGVEKCNADPLFNQKVAASDDPIELVVSEWKRDQLLSQISDPNEFAAYQAWKASQPQAGQPLHPTPSAAPASRPAAPPVAPRASLAGAPSAGRSSAPEARDGESTFSAMFG